MRLGTVDIKPYSVSRSAGRGQTRTLKLWRARWRVYFDDGRIVQPKRGGFATKAMAEEFVKQLQKAEFGTDGWRIDDRGHPVLGPVGESSAKEITILGAMRLYARAHFPGVRPTTVTKIASVLAQVAALTLGGEEDRHALLAALARRTATLCADSCDPAEDAALALREAILVAAPVADAGSSPHVTGITWLEQRSLQLSALGDRDGLLRARLFQHLVTGRPHATGRTYWGTFVAFVHWLLAEELLTKDPLRGFSTVRRDPDAEAVDPERVPDAEELAAIVAGFDERGWRDEGTMVLVAGYAALRGGESYGLDVRHLVWKDGRWWVRVSGQVTKVTKRHERVSQGRQPTKESRGSVKGVLVPLPAFLSERVGELRARRATDGQDAPLFVGVRGRRITADSFRDAHWAEVVGELFRQGHRLEGISPHVLRKFGMTQWLRTGVDHRRCQRWGRWASLSVMLDVYAAILPSDEVAALAKIDAGSYGGGQSVGEILDEAATRSIAKVIPLAQRSQGNNTQLSPSSSQASRNSSIQPEGALGRSRFLYS